jgi:hypothetical protein
VCDSAVKFLSVIVEIPLRVIQDSTIHRISSGEITVRYLLETFVRVLRENIQTA